MKIVGIFGHFGNKKNLLNGQTVKTKIVTNEIKTKIGSAEVEIFETYGGIKRLLILPVQILKAFFNCENIIIFPATNGLKVIVPLLSFGNIFFKRKLHYVVIGGWLPEFIKNREILSRQLKKFNNIFVETNIMKNLLHEQGFKNIIVMPNCKVLGILEESELVYNVVEPLMLCTFSRVMKEKGIEDAIEAVTVINKQFGRIVYTLDIYGQIDNEYEDWFDKLQKTFPEYVKYCGLVPYEKSVEVLKYYYALLFPTYYKGEGFAGTLLDAYAAGIPLISSDWKYNSEIVKNNKTGLLYRTKDKKELIDKLRFAFEEQDIWISMKKNCLIEAHKYTPEFVLQTLMERLR